MGKGMEFSNPRFETLVPRGHSHTGTNGNSSHFLRDSTLDWF